MSPPTLPIWGNLGKLPKFFFAFLALPNANIRQSSGKFAPSMVAHVATKLIAWLMPNRPRNTKDYTNTGHRHAI